jgi:hypothetical protein
VRLPAPPGIGPAVAVDAQHQPGTIVHDGVLGAAGADVVEVPEIETTRGGRAGEIEGRGRGRERGEGGEREALNVSLISRDVYPVGE